MSEFSVEIRRADTSDASTVAKILYETFAEFESLYTVQGFAATTSNAEQVSARMQEGPVWIAMYKSQPVGTVASVLKSNSVYMRGMAVLPAARGLGVGAALLRRVEQWASEQHCDRIFLSTTPFLSAAIALYEKSGFRRIPDPPHDLFGTPLLTMEKFIHKQVLIR
jgi:GNAT superfamily N-acetyltransferase